MASSNSLVLLPPRQTAQAPHDSSSSRPVKPSKAGSFGKKLEKAKSLTASKNQTATPAVKPKAAQIAAAKPAKASPATDGPGVAKPKKDAGKKEDAPEQDRDATNQADHEAEPRSAETVNVDEHARPAGEKKPVKNQKPATAKSPPRAEATSPIAARPAAAVDAGDSDAKDPVDAVGEDDSSGGGDDLAGDSDDLSAIVAGEFGGGKAAVAAAQVGNSGAANGVQAVADATADPSASPAAVIAAVDMDPAAAAGVSTGKSALRLGDHPAEGSNDTTNLNVAPSGGAATAVGKATAAAATPQAQFVEENHPRIVTAIQGQLMPHGGTVQLRLDPPELGALQVTIHMKDGVVSASFETSNDDATKLLSHSLGQLKSSLEAAGVSVDKIHVEQAPRHDSSNDSESDSKQSTQDKQGQAQQDQQRREMVQRMWRKLAGGGDPLDLVA